MQVLTGILFFGVIYTVAGCAVSRNVEQIVDLPAGLQYRLLPASALGRDIHVMQKIRGVYGNDTFVINSYLKCGQESLSLVATAASGATLFTLAMDARGLETTRSPFIPQGVKATHVLADIQLIYWPIDALRKQLSAQSVTIQYDAELRERTITKENKVLIVIKYSDDDPWESHVFYRNFQWGYAYDIDTIEYE